MIDILNNNRARKNNSTFENSQEVLISFGGIYRMAIYDSVQRMFQVKDRRELYLRPDELDEQDDSRAFLFCTSLQ
jgi:hypothetical protein